MTTIIAGLVLSTATPAIAGGSLLQTQIPTEEGGFIHPAMLVGFTPQPEPPGHAIVAELIDPRQANLELIGLKDGRAELLFAVGVEVPVKQITVSAEGCEANEDVVLWPAEGEVRLEGACAHGQLPLDVLLVDGSSWNIAVDISGSGFGDPMSIVGFTPQPEPPGMPAAFGLAVRFDSARVTSAYVTLSGVADGRTLLWQ